MLHGKSLSWSPPSWLVVGGCAASLFCASLFAAIGFSAEPAEEFLQQLRARGYFDVAYAYLDALERRGSGPAGLPVSIPFQRAITLLEQALQQGDVTQRGVQLQRARELLEQFLAEDGSGAQAAEAQAWRQKILLEQARSQIARAGVDEENRAALQAEARKLYEQARQAYEPQVAKVRQALESLAKLPPAEQDATQREQWRAEYLELKLIVATIEYELADTFASDSASHAQQLRRAAEVFHELAEKYRTRLVGQHAVLLQGKCYQRLGETQLALTYFDPLLDPAEQPEPVRRLSARAATAAMECLASPALNQLEKAIQTGSDWLQRAGSLPSEPLEYQDLRLALARVLAQRAEAENNRRYLTDARKQILAISRSAGPRQRAARELLMSWKSDEAAPAALERRPVKDYAEARLAGDEAREAAQAAELVVRLVEPRLAAAESAEQRNALQQELETARAELETARGNAIAYYQQALELAPPDLALEERNTARYYLCYLFYRANRFHEAAVLGEFLARRFSETAQARPAANIALAALLQLMDGAGPARELGLQPRHVLRIADFIATTWPEQKEAQDALLTLVSFMVRQGDLSAAQEYLRKIPSDSPRRGEAELRLGQALWASLTRERQAAGAADQASIATDPRVSQALELMTQGLERMSRGPVTAMLVQAALALAQIHIETDQPQQAIALLEDERYGPQRLAAQQHPLTQTPGFAASAVRTMLRAQLGQMALSSDASGSVEPLRETMRQLEASLAGTPDADQRLLATYVGLAGQLKGQLPGMPPAGRERLAEAFELFLQEVLQAANRDPSPRHWVAETYMEVAEALEAGGGPPLAVSKHYRQQAAATWEQLLEDGSGGDTLEPDLRTHIRLRLAAALRHVGRFDQALDELEKVLLARNNLLNVQIEAAETLQAAADAGREGHYVLAIKGARRNNNTGRNTLWGWERIARATLPQIQRDGQLQPQISDAYFKAQLNIPRCRYGMARNSSGDEKTKFLSAARRFIEFTAGVYPDLGGPAFRQEFDQLLKEIQQALGEVPIGLPPPEAR